jgi:disulfide bond formation protein DsbB
VEARCDIPTWFFLGLAMPAWNAIFSFLIAGTAIFLLRNPDAQKS